MTGDARWVGIFVLLSAAVFAAGAKKPAAKPAAAAPVKATPVKAAPVAAAPAPVPTSPQSKVVELVGEKITGVLAQTQSIQGWRVASTNGLRPDPARAIGSDFVREVQGGALTVDQLAAFRGVLYDATSYRFDADVSKCDFVPNVSFSMVNGVDTVEALVSFNCNQLLFFVGKPGGRWLPGGTFDVKPARAKLVALAKQALPNDAPTQSLK